MPSRKIDDLQVTITGVGVELAQDGVGVVQVDAGSIMRLIDALQDAWYQHAGVPHWRRPVRGPRRRNSSLLRRRRVPFPGSAVPVPSDDELVRPGRPECCPGGGC